MTIQSVRRYYLGKRRQALELEEWALADVWATKQVAEPGTALPLDFPLRSRLADNFYLTDTDLLGADEDELIAVGFNQREATTILAWADALSE